MPTTPSLPSAIVALCVLIAANLAPRQHLDASAVRVDSDANGHIVRLAVSPLDLSALPAASFGDAE